MSPVNHPLPSTLASPGPHIHSRPMSQPPRSAYDTTGGITYFPRLLDKIRLHARGELRPDFHENLGKGADKFCSTFLRVTYEALKTRVLSGGTDEEILEWCFTTGRRLNQTDIWIWNQCVTRFGWRDKATPVLEKLKAESGLAHRDDIVTMVDYFEVDEGRKA